MSENNGFRKTAPAAASESAERKPVRVVPGSPAFMRLEPKEQLRSLIQVDIEGKPFSELFSVSFDHRGAVLLGHVLLDMLEEQGLAVYDYDAVGALTAAAVPMVSALVAAAASRGENLNGFVMDFVYPAVKGPSIEGKNVLLLDAWLSEKSYVQTSSLVTLRNGNELGLDLGIIQACGAKAVGIAAIIGGVDMDQPTIEVVNPVNGERMNLPFYQLFHEQELKA